MLESLITISLIGLIVGIIFSVPVAGPISILVTSHALKGEGRYCIFAALGASIIDFFYCFIAIYGFTKLFLLYQPIIPYILIVGSVFLILIGIKIIRTKLVLEDIEEEKSIPSKIKEIEKKGGFWTGIMLNFVNPSLFIGWLTSSFIVMSFAASLGFNVGGLDYVLENNVVTINGYTNHINGVERNVEENVNRQNDQNPNTHDGYQEKASHLYQILNSLAYAFCVAFGTIIWFYYFSRFIIRNRKILNINTINKVIQALGIILCGFGIYLIYGAYKAFIV